MTVSPKRYNPNEDIAIVGLSVNLPGAEGVEAFWENLRGGVESIRRLSEQELRDAGESAQNIARQNYVPAAAMLDGYDQFDAEFFGFSPKDAAILDPQHRKFLEVAWEAMEQAGHPPETLAGPIGVYAGCGMGSYFYFNICSNPELVDDVGMFLLRHTGNDKDFLSTRVSHVFDLKGPSINLQTACSTSLVAIHYAAQALRAGEVDMALAGGVTIELPQGRGYLFKENEILSPDGHCHAFDHRAQGTVFGSGAGAVALRRLSDAQADGDHIWAVIKGSAINNDGAAKAGYLAPSVDGQTDAIAKALRAADVPAHSIGMVECHGTGTYLGDPIEVAALTQAYRQQTDAIDFCRIGSVKTNIGHLDTAAGVAGLAKAALSLHHGQIPPSLGYEAPNPAIPFEGSPFRVNDRLTDWAASDSPRRAAVNALGVGGTNAHAILEQAPDRAASEPSDWPFHVLCISGASKAALEANTQALAAHLVAHPELPLADAAFTLKNGRRAFDKRRVVVADSPEAAAALLTKNDPRHVFTHEALGSAPEVVFMFPGGGAQYVGMARDLYETEPEFAEWMDRGLGHLAPQLDYDIRALWLAEQGQEDAASERLKQPSAQLPLIAIVEYALAKLWMSWGVQPAAMVGHSMGENVAACLAGVMRFEDLIDLVLLRGRLFDEVPAGGMLSISATLEAIQPLLGDDLDIASVNGPELVAVSGPLAALSALQERLEAAQIDHQRVAIDIAAHSRMLDGILTRYRDFLAGLDLQAPQMPVVSNRTAQTLTAEQATDPEYWVEQLRHRVRFADCMTTLSTRTGRVYLEVGPGKALSAFAQMCEDVAPTQVLSSLRHADQNIADDHYFVGLVGRLWACGVEADWSQIWGEARRNRVLLPTYQFQRRRYFIEPGQNQAAPQAPALLRHEDITNWGSVPAWRPRFADVDLDVTDALEDSPLCWLVFGDPQGHAGPICARLEQAGHQVVTVRAGDGFAQLDEMSFTLAPEQARQGYDQLFAALKERELMPDRIAHFWLTDEHLAPRPGSSAFDRNLEQGFWSLTWLAQAVGGAGLDKALHIAAFTIGAAQVKSEALTHPEQAMISGPMGVLTREFPGVTCSQIDLEPQVIDRPAKGGWFAQRRGLPEPLDPITDRLLEDLLASPKETTAAYRGEKRFEMGYRPMALPQVSDGTFRAGGVYLITGGMGGIGQTIAADILSERDATVVLLSRDTLPPRTAWDAYVAKHGTADQTARRICNVLRLEALAKTRGGKVEVAHADVANLAQMRRVLEDLTTRHGALTGVIHAAGRVDDAPLLAKTDAQIDAVLHPKVQGLRVLDQLLPDGSLELLVLFSSTSTAIRAAGQSDYVAANAWLNAYAASRKGDKTRVLAINWGVWSDVGMAATAIGSAGVDVLPPRPVDAALIQSVKADTSGAPVYMAPLSTQSWLLDQHRTVEGQAILPGTGYIELLAEAARLQGLQGIEISDLYFLRALPMAQNESREMRISLRPEGEGYTAELRSECQWQGKAGWQLHAQSMLNPITHEIPKQLDLAAIQARCDKMRSTSGALTSPQEAHLDFGPRWRVLQESAFGIGEGLARLKLPEAAQGDLEQGHLIHAALMDIATGWAIELAPGYGVDHLWVPVSYGAIRVYGSLPAEVKSWVRLSEGQEADGFVRFDVTICNPTGKVLIDLSNFAMKRLDQGFDTVPLTPAEILFEIEENDAPQLTAAQENLAYLVSQGIRSAEGGEALRRALALGRPQVMVSSLPLEGLMAQADASPQQETTGGQSFERPDLEGSFVAPRNSIEERLAEIWSKLLGVSPVGVEDSFFDLGGHSLIAVRLFASVKREFDVEFPISILFEAPTIAQCAALIAAQTSAPPDDVTGLVGAPKVPERFEFLVPLNQSEQTSAAPLFVVAGMFGNVLNLRHLALPFAAERRVFGIQARGLVGQEEPHRDIAEAARDYLSEVQKLQPEGPYLLGGYSGGGVTAYEMAQQLRAQGHEVAVLAMLDTPLPVRPSLTKADRALIKLALIKEQGPSYFMDWAKARWAWELQKQRGEMAAAPQTDPAEFNNLKVQTGFLEAVGQYQTASWDGPLSLFRPPLDLHWQVTGGRWVSQAREYVFEDNEWRQFAPHMEVIEVPGDHDSMVLAPNVTTLAQELREVIAKALDNGEKDWQQATAAQ